MLAHTVFKPFTQTCAPVRKALYDLQRPRRDDDEERRIHCTDDLQLEGPAPQDQKLSVTVHCVSTGHRRTDAPFNAAFRPAKLEANNTRSGLVSCPRHEKAQEVQQCAHLSVRKENQLKISRRKEGHLRSMSTTTERVCPNVTKMISGVVSWLSTCAFVTTCSTQYIWNACMSNLHANIYVHIYVLNGANTLPAK